MRVRSVYFILTGALGGALGFVFLEALSSQFSAAWAGGSNLIQSALYFALFGGFVGGALGMTEGLVRNWPYRMIYGLALGALLGVLGGAIGGASGQKIFSLLPLSAVRAANADIVICLDESGSMRLFNPLLPFKLWFGNDFFGERRKAAIKLVESLAPTDRVAVVAFNDKSRLLFPLTSLAQENARENAIAAIKQVKDEGGTNLEAGLALSLQQLSAKLDPERHPYILFLTDGVGDFDPKTPLMAKNLAIKIFTIGLGAGVDQKLLDEKIAKVTGAAYFPVTDASNLWPAFQAIVQNFEAGAMNETQSRDLPQSPGWALFLLRTISWSVVGLLVGAGQGIRENSREDLRACSWGGLIGGAIGGAAFDPVASYLATTGAGTIGRALADIIVGACIGGSMRLAQGAVAVRTTLVELMPRSATEVARTGFSNVQSNPASTNVGARIIDEVRSKIERER
jgi:uncharacterized protein YegL